jgi:predicted ATP-binding protein involved in virulence
LISDILLRIYIYGKTPDSIIGIILIDEFDNHLHPDWQNGIVDKLHQIFPKIGILHF